MSYRSYKDYYDSTLGLMPRKYMKDDDSFNNVVVSAHYIIQRVASKRLNAEDVNLINNHLVANRDENNLYKPKNSKDNLIAKIAICSILNLEELQKMRLTPMVLSSWANPWDAIFYIFLKAPKWLKPWLEPLLIFVFLNMWVGINKKYKIRPHLHQRILWYLQGKPYTLRYEMNDGKHLALIKGAALKQWCPTLCRITHERFLKRYNIDAYEYLIMNTYYVGDEGHPAIVEASNLRDSNTHILI